MTSLSYTNTTAEVATSTEQIARFRAAATDAHAALLVAITSVDNSTAALMRDTLPVGTRTLFRVHGVLDGNDRLTDFGYELSAELAFARGEGPDPEDLRNTSELRQEALAQLLVQ